MVMKEVMVVMKVTVIENRVMTVMMERAEVMRVTKMAARPVAGVEMMARAGNGQMNIRRVRHERVWPMRKTRRRRHDVARYRMRDTTLVESSRMHCCRTECGVSSTHMTAYNMTAADMPGMTAARVPSAGMSASAVPTTMSPTVLCEKWICKENADAHAQ